MEAIQRKYSRRYSMGWFYSAGVYVSIVFALFPGVHSEAPYFIDTETQVFVESGATAELTCSVKNLGNRMVVWMNEEENLLTYGDRRITDDPRMSIERPFITEWNLRIRDVTSSDAGVYACKVNSNPVIALNVSVFVLDADPEFTDSDTSISVESGQTAVLPCGVRHIGTRQILWRKRSEAHPLTVGTFTFTSDTRVSLDYGNRDNGITSWNLMIRRVSVEDAGTYECSIASKRSNYRRLVELEVTA